MGSWADALTAGHPCQAGTIWGFLSAWRLGSQTLARLLWSGFRRPSVVSTGITSPRLSGRKQTHLSAGWCQSPARGTRGSGENSQAALENATHHGAEGPAILPTWHLSYLPQVAFVSEGYRFVLRRLSESDCLAVIRGAGSAVWCSVPLPGPHCDGQRGAPGQTWGGGHQSQQGRFSLGCRPRRRRNGLVLPEC